MQWQFLSETVPNDAAALKQILLENRRVIDSDQFFNPPSPLEITLEEVGIDVDQVRLTKERILEAIEKKQKIIVFGDYDADGICATAILWETLHSLKANVLPFIPHREKHGYGLTWAAIEELKKHGLPDVVMTVDTGITALEAVNQLTKEGVEVIVTDHHQPEKVLPNALTVVHTPQVSGAAVAWFLAREFSQSAATKTLDLVSLATVSDMMPLQTTNRSLVFHGIKKLAKTQRPGLKALLKVAGADKRPIDAGTIGFTLAPRINAMGRLSHGLDALRLLCTTNPKRAEQLAALVDETNADRQQLTEDLLQIAKQQVRAQQKEALLIAHSPDFHEGVVGLIAGRLAEWYAKPVIVISTRGETAKASARSVPGVNITELIRLGREHLLEVGGHPMAAGFGFEPGKLDQVINVLYEHARENIDPALLQKTLDVECLLPLGIVDKNLVKTVQSFAPFGQANPRPIFAFQDVTIKSLQTVGGKNQHLKLVLQDVEKKTELVALAWGKGEAAEHLSEGNLINVAGSLEINRWRERETLQMVLRDLQPTEA